MNKINFHFSPTWDTKIFLRHSSTAFQNTHFTMYSSSRKRYLIIYLLISSHFCWSRLVWLKINVLDIKWNVGSILLCIKLYNTHYSVFVNLAALCPMDVWKYKQSIKKFSSYLFFGFPPPLLILHLKQLFSYYRILKTSVKIYSVIIAVCFWLKKNEPFLTRSFVSPSRFALKSLGWNFHSNERSVKRSGTLRGFRKDTSTVIGSIF